MNHKELMEQMTQRFNEGSKRNIIEDIFERPSKRFSDVVDLAPSEWKELKDG